MKRNANLVADLLAKAGITINSIEVHRAAFYDKAVHGSLGLGESYVDGDWDCQSIDSLIHRLLVSDVRKHIKDDLRTLVHTIQAKLFNMQSIRRSLWNVKSHYDIGNDLYCRMLDKRMVYTCGYWDSGIENLDVAQERKLELCCQKLQLRPGMRVLDIGCGFGSFAKYAAEKYHVTVDGITISQEQAVLGREMCKGLPVDIHLMDYRLLPRKLKKGETYDAIVSLGMFEHVGPKNYRRYMQVAANCLSHDGVFLLHTIGGNASTNVTDPWINEYIFPEGVIPSLAQISRAAEKLFVMEDVHNFGPYYDRTLMAWHDNFTRNWDAIKSEKYDERFYRMWKYYLLCSAGSFRARHNQLWQIIFTKHGFNSVFPRIS